MRLDYRRKRGRFVAVFVFEELALISLKNRRSSRAITAAIALLEPLLALPHTLSTVDC